ncbi:MAG: hypothetical protein GY789_09150 [Hyphomicrobiales bacterium]|nr:hypothetical protein [Hyphomicrobiales bacterium]MCP4997214.1 hypothetical protein [Hyphomicrobiales bacterium]
MRIILTILIGVHVLGYVVLRIANTQVWDQDGHTYVIFPKSPIAFYYAYRSLTHVDGALTVMRFHIGPHQ